MAMVCNMLVATVPGTLVPLGLKAMKVDPALASSVFITTFTDVVGFASFLGFATIFIKYLSPCVNRLDNYLLAVAQRPVTDP